MKISSNWVKWCKKAGLRPHGNNHFIHGGRRKRSNWIYLKGHGFVWRVNCHNMFQRGDTYEKFDRWALCDIYEVDFPHSQEDFIQKVFYLVRKYNNI
jgi:hypothetical protein